ncbi:hypothetical protein NFI96_019845 [Prochilodus magdalenae]|nr:hypothetical protein NFI96_019845 [Prochilodus magdalenae]
MMISLSRALLFAQLSLLAFCASVETDAPLQDNHENVIDLLEAVKVTHIRGITKTKGRDPGALAWRFRSRLPHLTLPQDFSRYLISSSQGSLGLHLVGQQIRNSEATLISLNSEAVLQLDGKPLLCLRSSTENNRLWLEFRSQHSQKPEELTLPGGNPFSGGGWVRLGLSLEPKRLVLFVECEEATVLDLKQSLLPELPLDLQVTFSSTAGDKASKFTGYWQTAELSTRAYEKRPWLCNETDSPTQGGLTPTDDQKPVDSEPGVVNDQPMHVAGEGLRPPWTQVNREPPTEPAQTLVNLEYVMRMLTMLKAQNRDLETRVKYLESCACQRRNCLWDGQEVKDGHRWVINSHTMCSCTSGKVHCTTANDPCESSPCQNGGVCKAITSDPWFRCSCPPSTVGRRCEAKSFQACLMPKVEGVCPGKMKSVRRWFYDSTSASCKHFLFSGCGRTANNFHSRRACQEQCILGACCYRQYQLPRPSNSNERSGDSHFRDSLEYNTTDIGTSNQPRGEEMWWWLEHDTRNGRILKKSMLDYHGNFSDGDNNMSWAGLNDDGERENCATEELGQQGAMFKPYVCEYVSLTQCQRMVHGGTAEHLEVVSFAPGRRCGDLNFAPVCGCWFNGQLYQLGESLQLACEACVCTYRGVLECTCQQLTQRKEVRDMSQSEREEYHKAIQKLYHKSDMWEGFVRQQAEFLPQANDNVYFLPWHRYFLWMVERELRAVSSCRVSIPYLEWTVDAGTLDTSSAWQANMFGGDGKPGSECVKLHPFQQAEEPWVPCLRRRFNASISLPDAVTLQILLAEPDFLSFSKQLQVAGALFQHWVGGHMATPLCAYDPVFLSHCAFLDRLWVEWQERHPESASSIPSEQLYIKMEPFGVSPEDVMRSQQQLCTVYVPITLGAPCNTTEKHWRMQMGDRNNLNRPCDFSSTGEGQGPAIESECEFNKQGFDAQGYDRSGFDQMGWDRDGFGRDGYNRDHFDRDGYDIYGHNRYGFNRANMTAFGMKGDGSLISSVTKELVNQLFPDGFNRYGFSPFGLDRAGFDSFGFRVDGFDKDRCNFFFHGPHYLRLYFYAQLQMSVAEVQSLSAIKRICPPISLLPPRWASQQWIGLSSDERHYVFGLLEQQWEEQRPFDKDYNPYDSSVRATGLWLPVTPDLSEKQTWKSEWNSITVTSETSDYWSEHQADYAAFQAFPSKTNPCHNFSSSSNSVRRDPMTNASSYQRAEEYCPTCTGCSFNGAHYQHGERFPGNDQSEQCVCVDGYVDCVRSEGCPNPHSQCANPPPPNPPPACGPPSTPSGCNPSCGHPPPTPGHSFLVEIDVVVSMERNMSMVTDLLVMISVSSVCVRMGMLIVTGNRIVTLHVLSLAPLHVITLALLNVLPLALLNVLPLALLNVLPLALLKVLPLALSLPVDLQQHLHVQTLSLPVDLQQHLHVQTLSLPVDLHHHLHVQTLSLPVDLHHHLHVQTLSLPVDLHHHLHVQTLSLPVDLHHHLHVHPLNLLVDLHHHLHVHPLKLLVDLHHHLHVHPLKLLVNLPLLEDGSVQCAAASCSPVSCSNPFTPSGQCCPTCPECTFQNSVYVHGQTFSNPLNQCEDCVCQDGNVNCIQRCHKPDCNNPVSGTCCQNNCNGCSYAGTDYPNGMVFPHPTNTCRDCHCVNGNVQCSKKICPPLQCRNPIFVEGECCPVCLAARANCVHEGQSYRHGERFYSPSNRCQSCSCNNGTVICHRKPCPYTHCTHPVYEDCCHTCDGCMYNGVPRGNGATFADTSDPCGTCVCRDGSVTCERRPCPAINCPFPVQGQCCPSCEGCRYAGVEYRNGQKFPDPVNPCNQCECMNGQVKCFRKPCYNPGCSNPVLLPGHCCPVCTGPLAAIPPAQYCNHQGTMLRDGETVPDRSDRCSECTCKKGKVSCRKKPCSQQCSHPAVTADCCPVCEECLYEGVQYAHLVAFTSRSDPCQRCVCESGTVTCAPVVCPVPPCRNPITPIGQCCPQCEQCNHQGTMLRDGETVPDRSDRCSECTCKKGRVSCRKKPCSQQCSHPAVTADCCPVCEECLYEGVQYAHLVAFTSRSDPCQRCVCESGTVTCAPVVCPVPPCLNPITPIGQCCPQCEHCYHNGAMLRDGETVPDRSDRCSECTCKKGRVSCRKKPCSQQCSHPAVTADCCPVCEACLYEGVQYPHMVAFISRSDTCQRCMCESGTVTCALMVCPEPPCPNPITPIGQCCPQCEQCLHDGRWYSEGEVWNCRNDRCTQCTCKAGRVSCAGFACAPLTCTHQITDPNKCCPRCRGCMHDGVEHAEGSTWIASSGPCTSCMCVDGVTTCSEIQCLSPCHNQINVTGECCPLCADCSYEGHVYGPGETFHPSDDPCQICTCEVMSDGQQHLRCSRKQCPSLVDCPKHNILFNGTDRCCPVCAQPLSNCTETMIGNEVLATDDPCFTCQCKDLTWTCIHRACPHLSCPPEEQYTPPDSCCPVCNECVVNGERRVSNGESWTDSEDKCITCTCNLGHIDCNIEECPALVCKEGMVKVKSPGMCCYECQDPNVRCMYEGRTYDSNDHWDVDECTSCTCVSGDVHCQTERCPAVSCASDETPSLIPGMCCPHCIPRPATCIVFGDPHYRTFDGKMVNFQGACTYVLAQDCERGDFSIHVTNDDRGRKGVSWTKEVTVFIGNIVVQLLQDWVVKVDYQTVTLPFLKEPYVYLERKTNTILLNTNIGLKVLWNGRSHLEVSVPGTYKGHMCGMCGNFNNYPQDDMMLRNRKISTSEAEFGNSWRVGHSSSQCSDGRDIDPCKEAGYSARKTANNRCAVLKSAVFQPCHKVVPPEMFFASCVYDLCACGSNLDDCLCDTLEAYASECREAGVILHWRSPSLCAVGCPVERGYVFDECGPPCPKTCFNKDVPLGVITAHCFKPCVPGCQCPAGLVEHEAHCIPPEKCPKIIYSSS